MKGREEREGEREGKREGKKGGKKGREEREGKREGKGREKREGKKGGKKECELSHSVIVGNTGEGVRERDIKGFRIDFLGGNVNFFFFFLCY